MQIKTSYKKYNQRIEVTCTKADGADLDMALAPVILAGLLEHRKLLLAKLTLIPNSFLLDLGWSNDHSSQLAFDFLQEAEDIAFEITKEKWLACVDKMIWSFSQIVSPAPAKSHVRDGQNGLEFYDDTTGEKLRLERVQEGLELFGKYYRNLWA